MSRLGENTMRRVRIQALLVGAGLVAASVLGLAGTAQADSTDGVTAPDAVVTQDTGVHTVAITIGSAMAGQLDSLMVSSDLTTSVGGSFAGISASSAGGSCTGSAGDWDCEPGTGGWTTGAIDVEVDTAKATPCEPAAPGGLKPVCIIATLSVQILDMGTVGWAHGSIEVVSDQPTAQPTKAATSAAAVVRTTTRAASARAAAQPSAAASSAAAAASASPSASPSPSPSPSLTPSAGPSVAAVSAAPVVPSAPVDIDAADTAASSSGAQGVEVAVPIVVLVLAGAFMLWRRAARGRRRGDESAPGPDESDE